jgi:hypothetical protein
MAMGVSLIARGDGTGNVRYVVYKTGPIILQGGKSMERTILRIAMVAMMGVAAFLAAPLYAAYDPGLGEVDYQTSLERGIAFASGGVGLGERTAMADIQKDYDLKAEFAMKNGEYISGVKVSIQNANGTPVLEDVTQGPWFLAKLPAGDYKVAATFAGRTETSDIKVGNGLQAHVFYW